MQLGSDVFTFYVVLAAFCTVIFIISIACFKADVREEEKKWREP